MLLLPAVDGNYLLCFLYETSVFLLLYPADIVYLNSTASTETAFTHVLCSLPVFMIFHILYKSLSLLHTQRTDKIG